MNISFFSYNAQGEFVFQGEGQLNAPAQSAAIAAQINLDNAKHVQWVRLQAPGLDVWFDRDANGKARQLAA